LRKYLLLLQNKADVNAEDIHGETPLFYANNMDVVKILIHYNASINKLNIYGKSPLFSSEYEL
jgi:ankyrin repeat protein